MADYAVAERVRLRSGRIGTITRILVDGGLAMNCRYQVRMEPTNQLIGINGVDVMERLTPLPGVPTHVQNAARGAVAFAQWPNMYRALQDAEHALGLLPHVLQGSAAALLHGASVSEAPGDLDLCIQDMNACHDALTGALFDYKPATSSQAVRKYAHPNGTDVDLVRGVEFGVNVNARTTVQGVWVLSLGETLLSILLRPELRTKEIEAFNSLILRKGNQVPVNERTKIVSRAKHLKPAINNWAAVVQMARQADAHLDFMN